MANPVDLTTWLSTAGSVAAAVLAIIAVRRQFTKDRQEDDHDRDATDVASWTSLNTALDREIQRLRGEMDRMRTDYENQLRNQQARHERERAIDRKRIGELEKDVDSLQRLLRGSGKEQPPP